METDYEILESFLDGGLAPTEVQALAARLTAEPELAAVLDALRQERAVRQGMWQSLEPDEAAAQRFAQTVIRASRRRRVLSIIGRVTRGAVAAAACLTLGITTGWYVWGHPTGGPAGMNAVGTVTPHVVSNSTGPGAGGAGTYQVAITDENGNVVAVQKFSGLDEAREFAEDLGRYQERRLDVQDGKALLVSDRF